MNDDPKAADAGQGVGGAAGEVPGARGASCTTRRPRSSYDILAQKGGTKLYSRLSPLLEWATQGDGAPTQGLREVYAAQHQELQQCDAEFQALLSKDLAALNAQAASLGFGFVQ